MKKAPICYMTVLTVVGIAVTVVSIIVTIVSIVENRR